MNYLPAAYFLIVIAFAILAAATIIIIMRLIRARETPQEPEFERETPEMRAWKLLESILTPQQKVQAIKQKTIVERGRCGYYIIPLSSGRVEFRPFFTLGNIFHRIASFDLDYVLLSSFSQSICLVYTARNGPWYDAVATFLLHIRSGKEINLIKVDMK